MCLGGGGGTPTPTPPAQLPEAPQTPTQAIGASTSSVDARRKRAAAGGKRANGTILTSSKGVTTGANTSAKTLLGQ